MGFTPPALDTLEPESDAPPYETKLDDVGELRFRTWKQRYAPNDSGDDYDLRGAFRAGVKPDPASGHWPDTFKKPNHPTFSNQSKYAVDAPQLAGKWEGEKFIPPNTHFKPPPVDSLEEERFVPPPLNSIELPAEFAQADEQAEIERNPRKNAPQWGQNLAQASAELVSGLIPKSLPEAARLIPGVAGAEEAIKTAKIAKDVVGGMSLEEATKKHAPEQFEFVEAGKTPAGSIERARAGLGTVAPLLMAAGGMKAALREPVRPAIEPEAIPKVEAEVPLAPSDNPAMARFQEAAGAEVGLPTTKLVENSSKLVDEPKVKLSEIPEHLRPNSEVVALLESEAVQTGPQMKFAPASEGGALGFGGGKRGTKPLGVTPRGDTEFLKIDSAPKRILHGLEREGATDVIGRTKNKVGKMLSDATRKHVDTEQELFGDLYTKFSKPIQGEPRAHVQVAFDELAQHIAAKENGRPATPISPLAQKILTGWEDVAEFTGKLGAAHGVQVFDPVLGTHRPMGQIGRSYIPRLLKDEVQKVFRDPESNGKLFNELATDLANQRGIPLNDAATELRAEAGRFQANDFMGNLERARGAQLPESFYEYDLRNIATKYIPQFSERMAQIIAFGQRLGPDTAPLRPNLWDVARKEAANVDTQKQLQIYEDQAVNRKAGSASERVMARLQTAASGGLLVTPVTILRNTLSGLTSTVELMGARRSAVALARTILSHKARMNAREVGVIRDNFGDLLHADKLGQSPLDDALRSVVDAGFKYSGYNGSEMIVRSTGNLAASDFAKGAVHALNKNPASMRSKEALGLFKRMKVDVDKIVAENADWKTGPETRKFMRSFVKETQGGYRYDQVPAWANSNTGRFIFGFGRWSTQRALNIYRNGVKPILGERVSYKGKEMMRFDPFPLMKMAIASTVLGETYGAITSYLFGRDRRDASMSEIKTAWTEDEGRAVALAFERVINDMIMSGSLGIWGQPVDFIKSVKDQSRLRDPTAPPAINSLIALKDLGQQFFDQEGTVTKRDLLNFSRSVLPGPTQVKDAISNAVHDPVYESLNDMRTLRNAGRRWAQTLGLDIAGSPVTGGTFRKSEKAPEFEPIKEALLAGDVKQAQKLKNEYLSKQKNLGEAFKSLQASIKQSQPFRVGPYTALPYQMGFYTWAKKNLSAEDYNQVIRVQRKYIFTAMQAGLWKEAEDN